MKIAHCTAWYYPGRTGGTEAYVKALTDRLPSRGFPALILVPAEVAGVTEHAGTTVVQYPGPQACRRAGIEPQAAFETALAQSGAAALHLHSWMPEAGLTQLRAADALGIPSVMTLHLPAILCLRATMVFHGREACRHAITHADCAPCYLESRGRPRWMQAAWPAVSAALPRAVARRLAGIRPMLDTVGLVEAMRAGLSEAAGRCRQIVAVSQWQHEALLRNGVAAGKISRSRQGLTQLAPTVARRASGEVLRVGFIGRISPIKGLHMLIAALQRLPVSAPIELVVYGAAYGEEIEGYEEPLRRSAAGDARIRFTGHLPPADVFAALSEIDVLAVPSQWQETGPLVVLEAAAAGVPVLGSDLGGIAEWLDAGIPGWRVSFDRVEAWAEALQGLVDSRPEAMPAWPVKTMNAVADEMAALYRAHLGAAAAAASP